MLIEGGATWATVVATWALVCMRGDVLISVAALHSHMALRFLRGYCLFKWAGMAVGVLVDAPLMGTLVTGVGKSMVCVILWLPSIWGVGTLGGVFTLGTS